MASEIGPTLPRYMVTMIISLPQALSVGVRPRVRPTVAVALTASYRMSSAFASAAADSSSVDRKQMANDIPVTATALATAWRGTVR